MPAPASTIAGCAATRAPEKDSCAGKADGWYCSELQSFSSYERRGQTIALGAQCAGGQACMDSGFGDHSAIIDPSTSMPGCR